jgi:ADP-ribose pyrophosphatase YjhB (NUDIX family)
VIVRGVEIRVVRGRASAAGAGSHAATDETSLRAACAATLAEAVAARRPYVALPASGIGPAGLTPKAAGKVMVQEAIRVARGGGSGLREIRLGYPAAEGYEVFEGTVNGYLAHFLDTLIWGPFVVVDAIIETGAGIVLIERSNPPFGFALPGGFVDYGESLEQAVAREAREETGLVLLDLRQFHTYSDPGRDPRFHTISTVFAARAEGHPRAGDDAAAAREVPVGDIPRLSFAFDHGRILEDWLRSRER